MAMTLPEALAVVARHRGNRVVIPTMASIGEWPKHSDGPLDFSYIPSAMGQGPALGLGLALAKPAHGSIVLCGDGSLLMNLGCLVTLASMPAEVFLIVLNNGIYEVTGGQPTAGSGNVDFSGLARAAGLPRVYSFADHAVWQKAGPEALASPGPVFISLSIHPRWGEKTPSAPRPMAEQIERLQSALGVTG